jgi:hypothetical protein
VFGVSWFVFGQEESDTCRVLRDGLGSRRGMRALAPELRAAGVEVHEMLPVRLFRRRGSRYDLKPRRHWTGREGGGRLPETGQDLELLFGGQPRGAAGVGLGPKAVVALGAETPRKTARSF